MALVYKNMTQKTYTFNTSTTITNAEIDNPMANKFGQLKCKDTDGNVFYIPIAPLGNYNGIYTYTSTANISCLSANGSQIDLISGSGLMFPHSLGESVVIDTVTYYGVKNAYFGFFNCVRRNSKTLPAFTVCGGKVKYVKYSSTNNTIETGEYNFSDYTFTAYEKDTVATEAYAYQRGYLQIPKIANDIILAISVEYDE